MALFWFGWVKLFWNGAKWASLSPPPRVVTGGGGAGWELPVPGIGQWYCPGPVWGGWVLAALLPGGCWGSPAWGQRPPRDRDASGRRPASGPGRAPRGDWRGPAWQDWEAQDGASVGQRPESGRRGSAGGGSTPSLTLRGSSRVGVPRAAPHAGPSRARGCHARGAETRDGAGSVGGQCSRPRPALREWGRAARAWPSVYVCACQSMLTACSPLAGPRRPAPPSVASHWPV